MDFSAANKLLDVGVSFKTKKKDAHSNGNRKSFGPKERIEVNFAFSKGYLCRGVILGLVEPNSVHKVEALLLEDEVMLRFCHTIRDSTEAGNNCSP